jgi:hypothetical protein
LPQYFNCRVIQTVRANDDSPHPRAPVKDEGEIFSTDTHSAFVRSDLAQMQTDEKILLFPLTPQNKNKI